MKASKIIQRTDKKCIAILNVIYLGKHLGTLRPFRALENQSTSVRQIHGLLKKGAHIKRQVGLSSRTNGMTLHWPAGVRLFTYDSDENGHQSPWIWSLSGSPHMAVGVPILVRPQLNQMRLESKCMASCRCSLLCMGTGFPGKDRLCLKKPPHISQRPAHGLQRHCS